jgi:hypothetical protein
MLSSQPVDPACDSSHVVSSPITPRFIRRIRNLLLLAAYYLVIMPVIMIVLLKTSEDGILDPAAEA